MPPIDPQPRSLERRLEAVERALGDDEPLERVDRLDELDARVTELEAAVQALRGYVGSVRAINEDVERRAELALRKADAVERHVASATSSRTGSVESDRSAAEAGDDRETSPRATEDGGDADDPESGRYDDGGIDDGHPLAVLRRRL